MIARIAAISATRQGWVTAVCSSRPLDSGDESDCPQQARLQAFFDALDRGVYLPCSQYEALFFSAAHTDDDIEATIAAAGEAVVDATRLS